MFKSEFHVHTRISKDSILTFNLLLIMLKIKHIKTVAITDHNEVRGALKYKDKFKKYGIEVIVGEEIFTSKGEIIGLGLIKKIEPGLSPKETIRLIKKQNGLVYVPHPFDVKRSKTVLEEVEIKNNASDIDFIEVHNGRNIEKFYDIRQNEIAEKYNIQKIIGSDSHTFFEIGRNYIISDNIIDINNIKNEIKNGKFIEKKCIKFAHKWTKIARLITFLYKGDIYGIIRIVKKKIKRRK